MPKTFVAQNVVSVNPLRFEKKGDVVTGVIVNCEVNYGEIGMTHQLDLWGDLTPEQRERAQGVYDFIKEKVEEIILGGE